MKNSNGLFIPILIIALGLGWLLNTLNILPSVNWLWTGGIGVAGILVLALNGLNQVSIVIGPTLIVGSVLSILRQTGRMSLDVEFPLLMVTFGLAMLVGRFLKLPLPSYLEPTDQAKKSE